MSKRKKIIALLLLAVAGVALAVLFKQDGLEQAVQQTAAEPPLPPLSQLLDCARRDTVLTTQQETLDVEAAALRAEEDRLAASKRDIQAMRNNGRKDGVVAAEREWNQASARLKEKINHFDLSSAPYQAGVLHQVQHCAFSKVRRQDLQQLCNEGTYRRFCEKYRPFQVGKSGQTYGQGQDQVW